MNTTHTIPGRIPVDGTIILRESLLGGISLVLAIIVTLLYYRFIERARTVPGYTPPRRKTGLLAGDDHSELTISRDGDDEDHHLRRKPVTESSPLRSLEDE